MIVGILALQGAVREHAASLARLGIASRAVKTQGGLQGLNGLILPGGESTSISLLASSGFLARLKDMARAGFPMFGTCAGMILLAAHVEGRAQEHIGAIDITVSRNATGRQVDSFETILDIEDIGRDVPAVFIRAPYITAHGPDVRPMGGQAGRWVAARQGNILVTSFHPELTEDNRVHAYFIKMIDQTEERKEA
jgi:pyridoxal 5'-phosphate synthase pdxT subunit